MRWLARTLGEGFSCLFVAATAITLYDVVARYVFTRPTTWAHELTMLICAVAFAVGGAYVQALGEHIRITVMTEKLAGRWRGAIDLLGIALGLVFLAGVLWGGRRDAWEALSNWQTTQTAFNSPTPAIVKPTVMVVAALMAVLLVMDAVRQLRGRAP
ncbi:MAG: TRAP transporter small permease [Alphaproteobacteria bacterium]|nr:TRAP transporter small permease [Alphaproteobacteria bacterium]